MLQESTAAVAAASGPGNNYQIPPDQFDPLPLPPPVSATAPHTAPAMPATAEAAADTEASAARGSNLI